MVFEIAFSLFWKLHILQNRFIIFILGKLRIEMSYAQCKVFKNCRSPHACEQKLHWSVFSTFDSNIEQNIWMKLSIRHAIFSREMNSFKTINQEMSLHYFIRILFWNSMDENFQIFLVFELVWMDHISHTMHHAQTHQHTCADDHSEQIHWKFSWEWQKKMLMFFFLKN